MNSNKHIEQLQALNLAFAATEQKLAAEIATLRQREEQIASQVQALQQQTEQASAQQAHALSSEYAEREYAFNQQLSTTQQELYRLVQEHVLQEKEHSEQTSKDQREREGLLLRMAQREHEAAAQLLAAQQHAAQEKGELARSYSEQESALRRQHSDERERLTGQLKTARREIEWLLKHRTERERGVRLQLTQLTGLANTKVRKLSADLTKRKRIWKADKTELSNDIQALQVEAQALKQSRDQAEQQHSSTLNAERNKHARMFEAWTALEARLRKEITLGKSASQCLSQALEDVQYNFTLTQATLTWRATAPLRKLASFLKFHFASNSNQDRTDASFDLIDQLKSPQPKNSIKLILPNKSTKMQICDDALNKATTAQAVDLHQKESPKDYILNTDLHAPITKSKYMIKKVHVADLLNLNDIAFIWKTYQTVLCREPDREGMSFYLEKVRSGISKESVIADMALSLEGSTISSGIVDLQVFIDKHNKQRHWFFRWFNQQAKSERTLNRLENLAGRNQEDVEKQLEVLTKTLKGVSYQIEQLHQLTVNGLGDAPNGTVLSTKTINSQFRNSILNSIRFSNLEDPEIVLSDFEAAVRVSAEAAILKNESRFNNEI